MADHPDVRRLRDFQIVGLDTSGTGEVCRVVAVDGTEAVLEPEFPEAVSALALPARASLSFETGRHPVLLSGAAGAGPLAGTLRFWVTDDVGVPPLRLRPRLKADFAVRVTALQADGRRTGFPEPFTTRDVSAGGISIAGHRAAPGTALAVELDVPGVPRPLTCTGRVVRELPFGSAVAFTDLEPGLAATLDRIIFTVRRRVARETFARAAATRPAG
jgi:hypothetical protein